MTRRSKNAQSGNSAEPQVATPSHLTARAYATHRGVSHQAVVRALREGRLKRSAAKVGSSWRIDPVLADVEWDRSTDPSMQRGAAAKARRAAAKEAVVTVPPPGDEGLNDDAPDSLFDELEPLPRSGDFNDWRTRREELHARLLWIEYLQKCGRLIDVEEGTRVVFAAARDLRNGLLALPSKLSGEFAGCTDPRAIATRLERAHFELVEAFTARLTAVDQRSRSKRAG